MKIQFLWWADCPSHPKAWERLNQALIELETSAEIERIEIVTEEAAEQWRFRGSPTILINGEDIDPNASELPTRLTCRLYRTEEGRPSPLPTLAMLKRAIIKAQGNTHTQKG